MNRLDDLLAQVLANGGVPDDATEAERAELATLLAPAARLRRDAPRVEAEAATAMPIARARFERFLANAARPAPVVAAAEPGRGLLGRLLGHGRIMAAAGAAVAIAIAAIVVLAGSQALTSNTDSANALTLDDYVQVQGVVASAANGTLTIHSDANDLTVAITDSTTTTDASGSATSTPLKAGDTVLVGGVATGARSITAGTLALSSADQTAPRKVTLKRLNKLLPGLQGRIGLLAVSRDGNTATVLLTTTAGDRYVVKVDGKTAELLLNRAASALGALVTVNDGAKANDGLFSLTVADPGTPASPSAGTTPAATFAGVRGVVAAREGTLVQVIDADRKTVTVVIRPTTRILLGESGLTAADLADPRPVVGHAIAVSGSREVRTGRIIADVIVVGPRLQR
jgi:hypothetical protein